VYLGGTVAARGQSAASDPESPTDQPKPLRLPFLADEARKRGVELPLPFGVGLVYFFLHRDIEIRDLRVGRNGAPPTSVSQFAQLASVANVNNLNLRMDVWIFPFLNVHAIVGGIWNRSTTNVEVTLPPITAGGEPRHFFFAVPTELSGSVGGLGLTLAAGFGSFFAAADLNAARADMGFSDRYKTFLPSLRVGWNGRLGSHPARAWLNGTYWDTTAVAKGTVGDPDGGTLSFEVDQGPLHPFMYGVGFSYGFSRRVEFVADFATDFHGGWSVTAAPVFRF
jgi:hypothetical protein